MTVTTSALEFYAANQAALFPIPAGQKAPQGIVSSWKHDHSKDPAQWSAWAATHPGCNFGVVAFASDWIIVDIDTSGPEGRNEAWALWCDLCRSWGLDAPLPPNVQSPSGGWHVYLTLPAAVDASKLRQPDAVKGRINIRCRGFVVSAGSTYQDRPYTLLSDVLNPAPDALIAHCTPADRTPSPNLGTRDANDTAALLTWLNERGAFASYEDWVAIGMALRLEFGDAGLELWQLTHDETVDADTEATKWDSFATDATSQSVTLNTFLARAHTLGWKGTVRQSTSSMFGTVAALATAAGATLPPPVPMVGFHTEMAVQCAPILTDFLANTNDAPTRPAATDFPALPNDVAGHDLFATLQSCLARIAALAESRPWRPARIEDPLAILSLVHADTTDAVCRRLRGAGLAVPKYKTRAAGLQERVERAFVTNDDWVRDHRGEIESDNPDNVEVLLGVCGLSVRFNKWLEREEVCGGTDPDLMWPTWSPIDDATISRLSTRAKRTKTRFRPGKDFLWDALITLARGNAVDPVCDLLDQLAAAWDGQPRLHVWLSAACGVPCDLYHQAVSRNIIGGMVRRIREPGCKHDTVPVFFGFQGSSKSTMAAVIADMGCSPLSKIVTSGTELFTDTIKLGDESKELILSLAGKCVAEIGEMGTRSNASANHIKAMVSRQVDEGRTAYARTVKARPRRNIFIGTANEREPLSDPTGNRRFLPVRVDREIDLAWLHANIAQLVGEAAARHGKGETFAIPREVWGAAAEHQEAARSLSDLETRFEEWFAVAAHTEQAFITASDLSELCDMANLRGARAATMERLGFVSAKPYIGGRRTTVWVRDPRGSLPKHIEGFTRYQVGRSQDGRVRVTISRMAGP